MTSNRRLAVMIAGVVLASILSGSATTLGARAVDERSVVAASAIEGAAEHSGPARERRIAAGERLFNGSCAMCHGTNGAGMARLIPPLARSDFIGADRRRAVAVVVNGYRGKLTVNGGEYNAEMPRLSQFSDAEFADILSYVFTAWGNDAGVVSAEEVAAARVTGQATAR